MEIMWGVQGEYVLKIASTFWYLKMLSAECEASRRHPTKGPIITRRAHLQDS